MTVATATELKALVLQFEENVKWSTFEGGEAEEAKEKSESKASRARKREPQAAEPPQDASAAKEPSEAAQQRSKKSRSGDVEAAEPKDKAGSPQQKPRGGGGSAAPAAAAPGKKETAAEKDEREREQRLAAREAAREAQRNKKGGGGGDSPSKEKGEDSAADAKAEDWGKAADEADAGRKREKMEGGEEEEEEEEVPVKRTRHSVKQETMLQQVMGSSGGGSPRKDPRRGGGAEGEEEGEEEEDDDSDDVKLSSVEGLLKAGIAHKNLVFGSAAAKVAGSASFDGDVPPEKVELKFWRLAQGKDERSSGGSGGGGGARELDTAHLAVAQPGKDGGGGFAASGEADEEPYASSPWNLRQLLRQRDCLLSHLKEAVPAEQRQLGFGALFGGHAWAVHEHFMYGLSYMHVGAPRTWYGLSGHDAEALQALLVSESSATEAAKCTFQLPALLAPSMLCSHELQVHPPTHPHAHTHAPTHTPILCVPACLRAGLSVGRSSSFRLLVRVQVSRVLQGAGEFVLTMPRAFHASFSHGFNCVESTTFATVDWLPWGQKGAALHRELRAPPAVCYEEVVLRAVRGDPTVRAAVALREPLLAISARHAKQLAALKAAGVTKIEKTSYLGDGGSEPCPSCAVSLQPAWLLSVHWDGGAVTDGEHTPPGCSWATTRKTVKVSRTQDELKKLEAALDERLAQRERWLEAAAKALDTEPPLEAVDALLAEARDMQIQEVLGERLQRLQQQGLEWHARTAKLLNSRAEYGAEVVLELLRAGEALPLQLPALEQLQAALDAARAWQGHARALLATSCPTGKWLPQHCVPMELLAALLTKPEAQLLRLPEADAVRDELGKLLWVSRAHGMIDTTPLMATLRELMADAEARGLTHLPVAEQLQKRCAAAGKWVQRANNALRRRTGMPLLETLHQEASGIAVKLEQMEEVVQRISAAQSWSARAKAALARTATVEEMRALQAEAEALDVTVPEESTVADKVSSMDRWLKKAGTAFLKRGCAATLLECLTASTPPELSVLDEEGNASSAGLACAYCTGNDAATLNRFMVGCDTCERWYHGPCVSMSKAAADAVDTYLCPECAKLAGVPYAFGPPAPAAKRTRRPRLRLVSTLLDEADEIGVEMPEVATIKELQAQAVTWQERAKEVQTRATEAGTPLDAVTLEALLVEGDACEVEPESLAPLRKLSLQCIGWRQRALAVLNGEHPVDVAAADDDDAETADAPKEPPPNSLPGVEALLLEVADLDVHCPEESQLRTLLENARAWQAAARAALASGGALADASVADAAGAAAAGVAGAAGAAATAGGAEDAAVDAATGAEGVAAAEGEAATSAGAAGGGAEKAAEAAAAAEAERLLRQLEGLPLQLKERGRLRRELGRKRWLLGSRQVLAEALRGAPPLASLREMVDEAAALQLDQLPEVVTAKARLGAAEAWRETATRAMTREADVAYLRILAGEAEGLGVTIDELTDVTARIEGAHGWAPRARDALARRATLKEVQELLRQAELAAVPMADRGALLRAEQLARWWRERVCETFLKKGCDLELHEALEGNGHYDLLGDDGEWSASLACSYCTGNDPAETSQFMVGCDTCERWYHGPCVSMSKAAADAVDTYLCPECAKLAGVPYAFGPPAPAAKRTRRPRLRLVSTLLDEADEIGVEMPEVATIKELQAQAVTWQERAKEVQTRATEAGTPLDAVTLEALLVEGDACEVEPESLAPLRLSQERALAMQEERAAALEQAPPHLPLPPHLLLPTPPPSSHPPPSSTPSLSPRQPAQRSSAPLHIPTYTYTRTRQSSARAYAPFERKPSFLTPLTLSLARQHKWSKTSKDDGERVSEGRQDTLAGLHCQATTLQLPAAQVSAALAEHSASEAWRVKALELLRSTTPVAASTSNPHAHPGLHPDQVVLPDPQPLFLDRPPNPNTTSNRSRWRCPSSSGYSPRWTSRARSSTRRSS